MLVIKKNHYIKKKNVGKIWGINLKPEFPKKPDITIENDFTIPLKRLANNLKKEIKKKFN